MGIQHYSIAERQAYIREHLAPQGIRAAFIAEGAQPCCNRKRSYTIEASRQTPDGQTQVVKKILRPNFKADRISRQMLSALTATA
jgi:hypothetical protein